MEATHVSVEHSAKWPPHWRAGGGVGVGQHTGAKTIAAHDLSSIPNVGEQANHKRGGVCCSAGASLGIPQGPSASWIGIDHMGDLPLIQQDHRLGQDNLMMVRNVIVGISKSAF